MVNLSLRLCMYVSCQGTCSFSHLLEIRIRKHNFLITISLIIWHIDLIYYVMIMYLSKFHLCKLEFIIWQRNEGLLCSTDVEARYLWTSKYRLLDSLVVECWLRVREVPGSIPSQGPRHTKDVIKMVPVVPLFSTQHWKGKYWLFLKNQDKKIM